MRLIVTGGAGFIGSNFVRYVLDHTDHHVTTLDSLTYAGTKDNLEGILEDERHQFVKGDIRDADLVDDLASSNDAIVNFAAESHVDRSIEGSEPFVSTNVQGAQVLLDAAVEHDHDRFVQISTDEVYGEVLDGEFRESDRLNPRNPYSATKASADLLAQSYYTTHGLPILITRSSNNFGPRQHREKLIPKFITRAKEERPLPLYGDGRHVREWTYVEDNCQAITKVLEEGGPGEVYNIGGGEELSNLEVTTRILDELGKSKDLVEFVEERPGHDRRYSLNCGKIHNLGWSSDWTFEEGLQKTVKYYNK